MRRVLHDLIKLAGDSAVRAESALLERPARSLDGVGVPVLIASHRRSGTHLTLDLLRRNFPACRPAMLPLENPHHSYLNIDRFETGHAVPVTQREALRLLGKAARPLVKTHSEPGLEAVPIDAEPFISDLAGRARTLYVHRDGKKVMCSMWTWRKVFDPEARVPFSEFIRQPDGQARSRVRVWGEHVSSWLAVPDVLAFDFDRIVRDTASLLTEIGAFIGETPAIADPPLPRSNRTRWQSYLSRLTGNLESTNQHAAGDRPPKPAEVFTAEDDAFYESELQGLSLPG